MSLLLLFQSAGAAANEDRGAAEPFQTRAVRSRRRLTPLELNLYPTLAVYASLVQEKAFRRKGWRKLQALPELDDYPQIPSTSRAAEDAFVTRTLRARRLQKSPDPIGVDAAPPETTPAVYASLVLNKAHRRHGWRKEHHPPLPNTFPQAEPPVIPEDQATGVPFATRVMRSRRVPKYPGLVYEFARLIEPAAVIAATPVVAHRRHQRRPDIELSGLITSHPVQPITATIQIKAHRRTGWRKAQTVPQLDLNPPSPQQIVEAWKAVSANRRRGWREIQTAQDVLDTTVQVTAAEPAALIQTPVVRRRGWRERIEVPSHDYVPSAPPLVAMEGNPVVRRHGWRRGLSAPEPLERISALGTVARVATELHRTRRRHGWRRIQHELPIGDYARPPEPDFGAWFQVLAHRRHMRWHNLNRPVRMDIAAYTTPPIPQTQPDENLTDVVIRPFMIEHHRKML